MENVIVIDAAIVRAMVEAKDAGLTFEQFVEMVNVAHEQYAILPDGEASWSSRSLRSKSSTWTENPAELGVTAPSREGFLYTLPAR